jgi:hypothetical protein
MEHEPVGGLWGEDGAELMDRPVRCRMLGHIPMDIPSRADFEHDEGIDESSNLPNRTARQGGNVFESVNYLFHLFKIVCFFIFYSDDLTS